MSKRGLSREEKRTRLVDLFHESAEFFTLKELEKVAPKQKGIVQQSVKEILDELVSDGLVSADKIGTSNCQPFLPHFWAFPSTAGATKQAALDKANAEADAVEASIASTKAAIKAAAKGREDTPERQKLLAELTAIRKDSERLKSELAAFGAVDPVRYTRKKEAVAIAQAAARRWTENTMILWALLKNSAPEWDEQVFRSMLGISDTWEDI
ncbi:meiotic nuclear division protein 1 [Cutaneotrichosporon oleaginosum]|uniref:Meiotic nuclear division protein 1 n=1 Tax=Cutaneotrichosporon oleaginosum TaxID=879819 RepID=A0A0J0XQQ9_9TREE|nr:meiotic nuclear division protein 1 [Cutaneotrichosporon oleaginosum]KLT43426.1 meiotic nuclear division protein 1 [Cutaneotrichosporon oleaginosum]